jgi:VWFA-related protein
MMARVASIPFWAVLLLAMAEAGEQKLRLPPPFRSEAELVTVDIVVLDKHGEPIADLQAADFVVSEDGRDQRVQFFQPVVTVGPTRTDQRAGRTYGYSTNVGAQARPGRSFVLFFDDVHLSQEQGERARKALEQFLNDAVESGDVVSLVAPGRALRWHARLPDGRPALLKVLESLRGGHVPEAARERISDYEAYRIHVLQDEQMAERVARRFSNFGVAGRNPVDLQRDEGPRPEKKGGTAGLIEPFIQFRAAEAYTRAATRNLATLGALADTIDTLTPIRARKSIIIVSPGFILDQELAAFRQVEDAARRANIAMYFVDARGLEAQSAFGSAQFGSPLDSRDVGAANADLALESEGAVSLAESSGGFSVQNSNDLAAGLRRIGRESQAYYLLGYSPANVYADGKFRRINVRVGRPDVQVRARKGYYAGGVRRDSGARGEADALETVLESPYDLGAVPLRAAAFVFGQANTTETSVLVAVEADLRAFELKPDNGMLSDVLDLRLLVTDPETGEAKRYERAVEMTLQNGAPRTETSAWYPLSQPLELRPGRYQARIAVRDRNSGRLGSVTHDFEVPRRAGMTLSSVIVTDTIEKPVRDSEGPPKPVLILRRLLNAGATLYYQFAVFDPGRTASGETRVKAGHLVRRRDGSVVKELKPTPLVPGPKGMSRFAGISLAGVPAGEYELILSITDEVRGETAQVREAFAIAEPERVGGVGSLVFGLWSLVPSLTRSSHDQRPTTRDRRPTPVALIGAQALPQQSLFENLASRAAEKRDGGRLEDALVLYREALALRPDWEEGRWYAATLLYELDRYADARDAFAEVLRRQPAHAGAMGLKGLCEFELHRYDRALTDLLEARKMGVSRSTGIATVVRYHAAILLTRFGEFEVANQMLTEFAAEGADTPQIIEAFGLNVLRMPVLPAELAAEGRERVALAGRAGYAMAARHLDAARGALDELIARYPKTPQAHYARGVFLLTEDADRALEEFRRELEISPSHVPARLQIAFEFIKRGEPARARPPAEEAAKLAPDHFATRLAAGQVLLELNDIAAAIPELEKAAALAPGSPQVHFILARAYARAGRDADAERERAEFTRLDQLVRAMRNGLPAVGGIPSAGPGSR